MSLIRRVFVTVPGADAREQAALGRCAEAAGWDGMWVRGAPSGDPDSYAMVAAAGVAAVTTDLRVGVVLGLSHPGDTLRLAEDLGVLDHCSSGRAECWLRSSGAVDGFWESAERLLAQLRWCAAGGRRLAVTPGSLQPTIPMVADTRGPHGGAGIGRVVDIETVVDTHTDPGLPGTSGGRCVLQVGADRTAAVGRATGDPEALEPAVRSLRHAATVVDAEDVVFSVSGGPAATELVGRIGAVVAPILRANEEEVRDLIVDTVRFWAAFRDLESG